MIKVDEVSGKVDRLSRFEIVVLVEGNSYGIPKSDFEDGALLPIEGDIIPKLYQITNEDGSKQVLLHAADLSQYDSAEEENHEDGDDDNAVKNGEIIDVKVVEIKDKKVFVEIDEHGTQYGMNMKGFDDIPPQIGSVIKVYKNITRNGLLLSYKQAINLQRLSKLSQLYDLESSRLPIDGEVLSYAGNGVKNPFVISILDGVFLAKCESFNIDIFKQGLIESGKVNFEKYVGLKDKFIIIKIIETKSTSAPTIFVSRREYITDQKTQQYIEFFREKKVGDIINCKVHRFAISKDLDKQKEAVIVYYGSIPCVIERDELSWGYVGKINKYLKTGEMVDLKIISINKQTKEIKLSYRQTYDNPWHSLLQRYSVGGTVNGTVTGISPEHGIFLEIEKNVEGIVHISDVSSEDPAPVFKSTKVGDVILVKILRIDTHQKKLSLGIRQINEPVEPVQNVVQSTNHETNHESHDSKLLMVFDYDTETRTIKGCIEDGKKIYKDLAFKSEAEYNLVEKNYDDYVFSITLNPSKDDIYHIASITKHKKRGIL